MNLLILTVTAGHGHNQTAKAISDFAQSHGHNAPVLDAIEYINPILHVLRHTPFPDWP